ncbi:MAG: helix-turn-helix domain-containing protein [Alphaproteobacteria bacterium]|nr:helix-turn-helix domain-containing protein [Alphaproteobacteria bacterium]
MTAPDPIRTALWHIDARLGAPLTLDGIAEAAGVSRFHLARAFPALIGRSVMGYVRARRLSEAAKALAGGAPDILTVALDWGYGSHEAFTRAFRDHFAATPEQVRAARDCSRLDLVEPITMTDAPAATLSPPRIEEGRALLLAGLSGRYDHETRVHIPALWRRFIPYLGAIPRQVGDVTYGACSNADDSGAIDYLAGVEVSAFDDLPAAFSRLRVPAHRYAVFTHRGHISGIRGTWSAIMQWLPASGHVVDDAPDYERYGADFDPMSETGAVEIWIPIKS